MEALILTNSTIEFVNGPGDFDDSSITSMKIEVTHKTVNGRTYAHFVMIEK